MWQIKKEFECDYGHRVHAQILNPEFSIDDCLVCRHLHGHRMKVAIQLEGEVLDNSSMITDFKHLNWFKKFIDEVIDHKFIIDVNDPLFERITGLEKSDISWHNWNNIEAAKYGTFELGMDLILNEHLESFVIVNFVPTSERLSAWFYYIAQEKMSKLGVKVASVVFNETPKSESVYIGD